MKLYLKYSIYILLYTRLVCSCKKLVEIDAPRTTIVTEEAFKDSANASSSISGIYGNMVNNGNGLTFMNGSLTTNLGKSADELIPFQSSDDKMFSNTLTAFSPDASGEMWVSGYKYIYQTNACIEGLDASPGISASVKKQFSAEAKFLRALFYFYLTNLFGDVPLVTTTDYHKTALATNTPKDQIYAQIVADLNEAKDNLPTDYAISKNDRIRANRWAAEALLARVYLYKEDWTNAEATATDVINNTGLFNLNPSLESVFLKNESGNNEAILQWQLNTNIPTANATQEGYAIVPLDPPSNYPRFNLSDQLYNAFEDGDQRKVAWVDSTVYGSPEITYYFPYKYKIGEAQKMIGTDPTEYVTVLRLAEQYLIRAEARAQQSKFHEAIADLNIIRERAGLIDLPDMMNQSDVLAAVMQERRIELFAEWGHRWLDIKRTGQIDAIMTIATPLKGQGTEWQSHQQLFPISKYELSSDPNLVQNPGY